MTVPQLVLPFRGEFGMKLRYHVPAVHAWAPDVVCMEWGEEALYPTAAEKVVVARNVDEHRRDTYAKDREFLGILTPKLRARYPRHRMIEAHDGAPSWFIPTPQERVGLAPDVVVCPRKRTYGPGKNWAAWPQLTAQLQAEGLRTFAAGALDASASVPGPVAWDHYRYLDASIEGMLAAKVVVATDAGLALLALLCGRPLIVVVTEDGKAAPGPVITEPGGRAHHSAYWPIRLEQYYHPMNHTGAPIHVIRGGWEDPGLVSAAVVRVISAS